MAVLILGAIAGLVCAQTPTGQQPEITTRETPITFSSRVNLISVPVVVRDRDGRAVGTLQQDDFQLFDKGKRQVITKFSLERSDGIAGPESGAGTAREPGSSASSALSTLPERYIAYLVDDIHLERGNLLDTKRAMLRHLDEGLEAGSRAAIFTTSGLLLAAFTGDREKLRDAINRIQPYTSGVDRQSCPSISYYLADKWVNQELYLDGSLFSDKQLLSVISSGTEQALTAAYAEAQTCTLCPPGAVDQMSGLPRCAVETLIKLRTATRFALTYGDHETDLALGSLRDVIRKLSVMPGSRNLVLVSPGFLLTRDHRSGEYDVLDRAIRASITVNTIDMRGLFTTIPGGDGSSRGSSTPGGATFLAAADADAAMASNDVLAEIANGTGGTFFHNDNDLRTGLARVAGRPEYVYVLGFSPQDLKLDGSYHGLKVTVRNASNLTVQARRGYWAPKHAVDSAEAAHEEIEQTVFSRDELLTIPLDVQTEFFAAGDSKFELTVTARIDTKALGFRKTEDRNSDTVTVVAGLFDPNGNYVAGIQKIVELHLRDQTLQAFEGPGLRVKENFTVAPGRYLVRVVVSDAGGKTITARNGGVEIP